jgi:tRNA(Ile)-lysidine synthase
MPLLESYNPRVVDALLRTAHIATNDLAFITEEGARLWNQIAQKHDEAVILDKESLLKLPSALKRQLLRKSLEQLLGNLKDIEACHIEDMLSALNKPAGKRLDLPHGLTFAVEYERYLITRDLQNLSPYPRLDKESPLNIPGETRLSGWQVAASILSPEQMTGKRDNLTACFDLSKTGDKLVVRSRRDGDRFQPLGMSQPKKLNEFMIDAKIPRLWRKSIPLVCSVQQIIWVVGWRIHDRVKVTGESQQVLCLNFRRQ